MPRQITVDLDDIEEIIELWRLANEAPGGISALQAIQGMKQPVWNLEMRRRAHEQA